MKFLTLVICLAHFSANALETGYKWLNPKAELETGECFEYDLKTNGKQFFNRVSKKFCRTAEVEYFFHPKKGTCYEIDIPSGGKNYLFKVPIKKCRPPKTTYKVKTINGIHDCFEIDSKTRGEKYFQKRPKELCGKSGRTYLWKMRGDLAGDCYIKPEDSPIKVSSEFCRPEKPDFKFVKTGTFKGDCYEVHPEGPQYYIKKTTVPKCRPQQTRFAFIQNPTTGKGQCFEIDSESSGEKYLKKVNTKLCKE